MIGAGCTMFSWWDLMTQNTWGVTTWRLPHKRAKGRKGPGALENLDLNCIYFTLSVVMIPCLRAALCWSVFYT